MDARTPRNATFRRNPFRQYATCVRRRSRRTFLPYSGLINWLQRIQTLIWAHIAVLRWLLSHSATRNAWLWRRWGQRQQPGNQKNPPKSGPLECDLWRQRRRWLKSHGVLSRRNPPSHHYPDTLPSTHRKSTSLPHRQCRKLGGPPLPQ